MLKVSRQPDGSPEIFLSIQGEGASAGTPTVFLRLALCNLHCAWCDTAYTWDWSRYDPKREIVTFSASEVERRILSFNLPRLVVTGGEPMLQQKALAPLTRSLKAKGVAIEVETNGTIAPGAALARAIDQWNVSPKTANSGNEARLREAPDALRAFAALPNAWFKFVVKGERDLPEVRRLVARYGLPKERVLLMPQATDAATLIERSRWLADVCTREGYRLSPRLHVLLWGAKRGV